MSEVIRISEPTYKRLASLARGFDTPGNVIDRLLDLYERHHKNISLPPTTPERSDSKVLRLPRGVKTPTKAYYRPILQTLIDLGGKASVHEVLIRVEKAMEAFLNEKDRQPLISNPNELRWANTAKWARKRMTMMQPPLLKPDSPKKIWEITETGRRFFSELANLRGSLERPGTSSGASRSATLPPATLAFPTQPTTLTKTGFLFGGKFYTVRSAREVMQEVLRIFTERDRTFLDRFAARKHGKKRRFVARDRTDLYPGSPDLTKHSVQLIPGWWMGTNYSKRSITKIIHLACEVAGLRFGEDLQMNLG